MEKRKKKHVFTVFMLMASLLICSNSAYAKKENEIHAYYGIVNDHGIICEKQHFKLELPEEFEVDNRGIVIFNGETQVNDPNEDRVLSLVDLNHKFFLAENGICTIEMYASTPGSEYSQWADLAEVAKNSCDTFIEDMKNDSDYADGQGSCSEGTIWGQPCYIVRHTATLYGDPYYRTEIMLLDDSHQYLTQIYLHSFMNDQTDLLLSYFTEI